MTYFLDIYLNYEYWSIKNNFMLKFEYKHLKEAHGLNRRMVVKYL